MLLTLLKDPIIGCKDTTNHDMIYYLYKNYGKLDGIKICQNDVPITTP